ncbi:hypothetical protein [Pseudodesulfovibrio piezophilus]|nr:hypothetical protein [Pseudodesulfovibrio piezophilus]
MHMEPIQIAGVFDTRTSAKGYCARCDTVHSTVVGYGAKYAGELFRRLEKEKRIDFSVPESDADPRLATETLYGEARGQMFGVLVCRDADGQYGLLKAFSGQYNGIWNVEGWVPPLIDVSRLAAMSSGVERFIKRLGAMIEALPAGSPERKALIDKRKSVSQALMKDIHMLYSIPSFGGRDLPLSEVVVGEGGIPTGMGDCCAPKLLGHAARHSLKPLGLAEFYVGRENRSKSRMHGGMYSACSEKCQRILGHMLCGTSET